MALDEDILPAEALRGALGAKLSEPGNEDVLVVVRADEGAPYGSVRRVLEEVRAAGAKRIAIATRQKAEASS
jgi:biopolymer transport protein ExbD